MESNIYLNILKKSNPKKVELKKHKNKIIPRTIEIKHSPRREIIQRQKSRCFLCKSHFGTAFPQFVMIEGPDPETNTIERKMRAICQDCYFKSKKF
jgi:PP-loop superfamily ATP-utilizing enzyme